MMKLYSGPLSMFGAKAEIALLEKGIPHEREFVPFDLQRLYEPKHPVVLRVNPKQQVPVLVDGDLEIFDSTQIFEYLEDVAPEPALWPRDPRERARARQLELGSDEVFFPHVVTIMPQRTKATPAEAASAQASIQSYYGEMERRLDGLEFLAGTYSYADVAFFMAQSFASFLGAPWEAGHPRLDAWRDRVAARPAVARVFGAMVEYVGAASGQNV
jgi:glutathione S-transferase